MFTPSPADLHTHSRYSFDGDPASTIAAMCEAAIDMGLTHLAITDHFEISPDYPLLDVDTLWKDMDEAKKAYAGRLTLLRGVELGPPMQHIAEMSELLARHPYDLVLGSMHNLKGMRDFSLFDMSLYDDAGAAHLFERVLEETADMCDFEGIHVVTHLTYLQRYLARAGRGFDFAPHRASLTALFRKMIDKGLALEVNTSTVRTAGFTMPNKELLTLYRECGGTRVTLGSDGHSIAAMAQHFDTGAALLLDCGFDSLSFPTADGLITLPLQKEETQ